MSELDLKDQYTAVLTWIISNTAVSPCDLYIYMKSNGRFVQFQKKGHITRKQLIKKLFLKDVHKLYIRKEEMKYYIEFMDRFVQTTYFARRLTKLLNEKEFKLLEFPEGIQFTFATQKRMKEGIPASYIAGFLEEDFLSQSLSTYDEEKEQDILTILYDDVGLGSDAEQVDDKKVDETIELMNEMSTLRDETYELKIKIKALQKKEDELKQTYNELFTLEREKKELIDKLQLIEVSNKRMANELKAYESGDFDKDEVFKQKAEKFDSKIDDLRTEVRDFKLKYAREVENTKALKRDLRESQLQVNKLSMALKKITSKAS